MQEVYIPDDSPVSLENGENYDGARKYPKPIPQWSFIRVTASHGSLTRNHVHPKVVNHVVNNPVIHSMIIKGIAIPYPGCAIHSDGYEVVM